MWDCVCVGGRPPAPTPYSQACDSFPRLCLLSKSVPASGRHACVSLLWGVVDLGVLPLHLFCGTLSPVWGEPGTRPSLR
jgi:hypothetical protein